MAGILAAVGQKQWLRALIAAVHEAYGRSGSLSVRPVSHVAMWGCKMVLERATLTITSRSRWARCSRFIASCCAAAAACWACTASCSCSLEGLTKWGRGSSLWGRGGSLVGALVVEA